MPHTKTLKTAGRTAERNRQGSSTGKHGVAIMPPAYGLDYIDDGHPRGGTRSGPLNFKTGSRVRMAQETARACRIP